MNYDDWLNEPLQDVEKRDRYEEAINNIMEALGCTYTEAARIIEKEKTQFDVFLWGIPDE